MPKDKRGNLLANFLDRTRLRNDIALEMGRRLTGLAWTPKGKYVDLVINNVHQGNYYLVEHIKVAKNRVNIKEMKSEDVTKATISGGYLMEMSTEFDEVNKFTTKPFTDFYSGTWGNLHNGSGATILPVMIKSPDEETMVEDQLTWIHNHVDTVQTYVTTHDARWYDYVDLDSFVDWLFVQQVVGNNEPLHPKSCYMYKDRDKKLCMGPLWDFDYATFTSDRSMFVYNYCIWYGFMKSDAAFRQRMVKRWPAAKAAFQAVHDSYVAAQAAAIKSSVTRDYQMWGPSGKTINGDESDSYDYAASKINSNLQGRIDQMNALVASFSN